MQNTLPPYLLDIDLDAFLSSTAHNKSGKRRVSKKNYVPWSCNQLREYLEGSCHLSRGKKIPGRFAIEHDAALAYMENMVDTFGCKIEVAHLDGHADLGFGDNSWLHVSTDWLAMDPSQRRRPPMKQSMCHPGSFLAYAIAARLLTGVTYAFPPGGGSDLPAIYFRDNNSQSDYIELKCFEEINVTQFDPKQYNSLTADRAVSIEPKIPFQALPIEKFVATRPFDQSFVCQSPAFTPKQSDQLLYVLAEYIEFDDNSEALP